ncbi:MAG: VCBS domain-containing protein, partial [Methylococcaceae bacterium]
TVSITGNYLTGDVLSFSGGYSLTGTNITASYDTALGKLTLTGTDTLAHYQAVLRTVTYQSTSDDPTDLKNNHNLNTRTIQWAVTDVNASSGTGGVQTSTAVTTTINITAVNDAPVITGTSVSTGTVIEAGNNGSVVTGTASASGQLSATDADTATSALTWSIVGATNTYGSMAIVSSSGLWTYTLDNTLATTQALAAGTTGTDTYTAQVSDGQGGYTDQTLTVTVQGTNDAPVANTDTAQASEAYVYYSASNSYGGVNPSGNLISGANYGNSTNQADADVDTDDVLRMASVSNAAVTNSIQTLDAGNTDRTIIGQYGSLAMNWDGTYTYTVDNSNPDVERLYSDNQTASAPLIDTFNYTIQDYRSVSSTLTANGASASSTLTVSISGNNDYPRFVADNTSTSDQDTITVNTAALVSNNSFQTATGTLSVRDPDNFTSTTNYTPVALNTGITGSFSGTSVTT